MEILCHRQHTTNSLNNKENNQVETIFQEAALRCHNHYRKQHCCPNLVFNKALSDLAHCWANYLANTSHIHHSAQTMDGVQVGENIAVVYSDDTKGITGEEITDHWYSEIDLYDFEAENGSVYASHFTQLVWKETKYMGISQAICKDGRTIIVANYFPQGNIPGHYSFNVLPLNIHRHDVPLQDMEDKKRNINLTSIKSTIQESAFKEPRHFKESFQKALNPVFKVTTCRPFPQSLESFAKDCLNVHNYYRKLHGSPCLKICKGLTALAQEWSEKLSKEGYIQHCNRLYKGQRLGENLMYRWGKNGGDITGSQVAETWYSQMSKYDFSHKKHTMDTGHFSQMIWKNSKEIGIGKSRNIEGAIVVVAFYHPAGNINGTFYYNVFPLSKEKSSD